jgi:hypothetical protein
MMLCPGHSTEASAAKVMSRQISRLPRSRRERLSFMPSNLSPKFPAKFFRLAFALCFCMRPACANVKMGLGDGPKPSQSDILTIFGLEDKLAVMAVEGKVKERFGKPVYAFLRSASKRSGKFVRLESLRKTLRLKGVNVDGLRYQLMHRTASAIYEAHRFRAKVAVMMVHSFDPKHAGLSVFQDFASCMGSRMRA